MLPSSEVVMNKVVKLLGACSEANISKLEEMIVEVRL